MTLRIPLDKIPSQNFNIVLNGQYCGIKIYQKYNQVFCDLTLNERVLFKGVRCLNLVNIVPGDYLGFNGKLYFADLNGTEDPDYTGFNDRWVLVYES
jgi:hypothetical protein